ncbi:DUF1036 domain-containing protein [Xanthobacter autotrophicus]|uniref:DUF1036 domain-containing protein n=1 Tax=Xanthobacter autotrophicus TaxID=280 RepID=UPI0037280987
MSPGLRRSLFAAAICALVPFGAARADIVFCNKYPRTVFVAIAYQQTTKGWLSRGWLRVDTGSCGLFDSALRVPQFYYRAETDWFTGPNRKRGQSTWGQGEKFAVPKNAGSFNYYNAATAFSGARLAAFSSSVTETSGEATHTITFEADGNVSRAVGFPTRDRPPGPSTPSTPAPAASSTPAPSPAPAATPAPPPPSIYKQPVFIAGLAAGQNRAQVFADRKAYAFGYLSGLVKSITDACSPESFLTDAQKARLGFNVAFASDASRAGAGADAQARSDGFGDGTADGRAYAATTTCPRIQDDRFLRDIIATFLSN